MRIVIVEDEMPNYRMLQAMVQELRPEWNDFTILESVEESVEWFSTNDAPDLIFIDIQLSDGISFSIFEKVNIESLVIFTTAYNEYALHAFKVNSIDYLLKPIKQADLKMAIEKFERAFEAIRSESTQMVDYSELMGILKSGKKEYKQRFLISGIQDFFKINTIDIAYFYTQNRITHLVTFEGKEHVLDHTMEKLEEILDPKMFFRANRSHILHVDVVKRFENYFGGKLVVKLIPPFTEKIIISRLKATDFKKWMDE